MTLPPRFLQFLQVPPGWRALPPWVGLSLALNGLLFGAVVVLSGANMVAQRRASPVTRPELYPGGAIAHGADEWLEPAGERQFLTYQQWVSLLQQEAIAARAAPRLTVLLGDSISLWFPPELLPGRRTWLNQGISGERSQGLYQRLSLLDENPLEMVFIMVGINDLVSQVPPEEVVANLTATVNYLRATHPQATLVLQSILPHSGPQATWEGRDRLLALPIERIQATNQAIAALAAAQGIPYLDLYPLFATGEGYLRPDLTTDGLHLNPQGYWVWRTAIALFLAQQP